MKNFNSQLLTAEERKLIEKLLKDLSEDNRDFIRAFWLEVLSIKDDVWKIAFLNSEENYYAVITTDKAKEPLREIINFLENFIETKRKTAVNINGFILTAEFKNSKVLFQIYKDNDLIYKTYTSLGK